MKHETSELKVIQGACSHDCPGTCIWQVTVASPRSLLTVISLALCFTAGIAPAQSAPDFTSAQNEAVKFLSDLVKIDTSNPPGNETRAAEYITGVLAAEGIPAQIYESQPGRGNVVG